MNLGDGLSSDALEVKFERLGRTVGKGTNHLSAKTTALAKTYLDKNSDSVKKSKLFMGEGTSPLMRVVREAAVKVGLNSETAIHHDQSRILYTVFLARNTSDILLGKSAKAKYKFAAKNERQGTEKIVNWWRQRWFYNRATLALKIEKVEQESLAYPVTHGARVPLYKLIDASNYELDFY